MVIQICKMKYSSDMKHNDLIYHQIMPRTLFITVKPFEIIFLMSWNEKKATMQRTKILHDSIIWTIMSVSPSFKTFLLKKTAILY